MSRVTMLPYAVQAACDAEAALWATETKLEAWLANFTSEPRQLAKLKQIAMQCFSEGAYRGALNVIDGKPIQTSILEARAQAGNQP